MGAMTSPPVLSDRALNRATLARQWLLERRPAASVGVVDAVEHLVGLQAQEPLDPYLALWSRLDPFDPTDLGTLMEQRAVVRIVVMRGTIHLLTADDAGAIRPVVQPVMDAEAVRHPDARHVVDEPLDDALAQGRAWMDESPRTLAELRTLFAEADPDRHAAGLAYVCRTHLPLVQVPPRGVWGKKGTVRLAHLETWVGRPPVPTTIDELVLRYLAAFGPATPGDVTAWCRLTGMRPVLERLRPQLRVVRDERGRELFDVPDGPLPDPDVPAPVRFLPTYDNALLSHQDRTRFFTAGEVFSVGIPESLVKGTVLHDGFVAGTWRWEDDDLVATVVPRLDRRARDEIADEAARVQAFYERDGGVRVDAAPA